MRKNLKKQKCKFKQEKGITLIALSVTIIILIILAGITIDGVFGDDGLLKQARNSKDKTTNLIISEEGKMNNIEQEYKNMMDEDSKIDIPFEPKPTPEPPTGGTAMSSMKNGIIEIKWLEGNTYNVTDTPNPPQTKTISNGTMQLVKYNSSSKTWVAGTEYSYVKGTGSSDNTKSKWANAKVTINNIDSYFVWIPRYAYRIIYFDSAESKKAYQEGTLTETDAVANKKIIGYSDSRGIVDASGKKISGVTSTTKTMVSEDYFMAHPAFINDVDVGGWSSELTGIWVGKYEPARRDTEGTIDGIGTTIKVQPGQTSFRNITIGNMYTYSKAYSTDLKSHMLKNSEWGAVAYLTESTYGRNGTEIGFNTNSKYLTGGGTGTAYVDSNKLQSSTGNEYGIYDLRGGACEYVASYYNGSSSLSKGSSFASQGGSSNEYAITYTGTSVTTSYKYGDATYETKSWHSDDAYFAWSGNPFFTRGGYYSDGSSNTGVFYFSSNNRWKSRRLLISLGPSSVMWRLLSGTK